MGRADDETEYSFDNENGYESSDVDNLTSALTKATIRGGGGRRSSRNKGIHRPKFALASDVIQLELGATDNLPGFIVATGQRKSDDGKLSVRSITMKFQLGLVLDATKVSSNNNMNMNA